MSVRSTSRDSSLQDVSCAEKSSNAGQSHPDALDEEAVDMKKSSAITAASVPLEICNRQYCCQSCGKDFGSKDLMILHLHEKHSAASKCYKCGSCYKSFPSSQQLTQHMLVHTNVRRYQCQYCDKAFKQLSHVQQHERIHTGELPYHCPVPSCDRSFRQLSSMKQHLKGHSQSLTPSNVSAASLSPSSEASSCMTLSPKTSSRRPAGVEDPPDSVVPVKHEAPDSSCSSSRESSLHPAGCSSESENSNESSRVDDNEEPVPAKKWHKESFSIAPLYQQSLIDLSSKLGEIKRRQRRLRLRSAILP